MSRILSFIALVLLSFCTLEAIIRFLCNTDQDGAVFCRSVRLKPYRLPVKYLEESLSYDTKNNYSGPIYDSELGWALRPDVMNHNAAGFITTGGVPEKAPKEGKLRIALLGDSYVQGNFGWGWWRRLEEDLNQSGTDAEVLNFGVGGYGFDQVYLRCHRDCLPWKPQIVICGFYADDCSRDLNILRVLRDNTTGIPFMKPRFLLEGEGLKLVNSPTPSPEELRVLIRDITHWKGLEYDHFFNPDDYKMKPWRWSRLAALIEARIAEDHRESQFQDFIKVNSEAGQIALRTLAKMRNEVEASGAKFYLVSLSYISELEQLRDSGALPHQELLEAVKKQFPVIETEKTLVKTAAGKDFSDYFGDGHYKPEFDAVVGKLVADFLLHQPAAGNQPVRTGNK